MEQQMLEVERIFQSELPDILATIDSGERKKLGKKSISSDGTLQLTWLDKVFQFSIEVRKGFQAQQIPTLRRQMQLFEPFILVCNFLEPSVRLKLRQEKISYVDTSGNLYLTSDDGLYVLIEGKKRSNLSLPKASRMFKKAGLKVLFQLLLHPEYINKPYRFIGEQAMVTIDTVGKVLRGLLVEKYIYRKNEKEYQWANRRQLFFDWVREYNRTLKPKLEQRRYKILGNDKPWSKVQVSKNAIWSGAVAAELMDNYLIPSSAVIYVEGEFSDEMKTMQVLPYSKGDLTMLQKFWKQSTETNIADPILMYADLIAEGNPRYDEAAERIFKKYINDKL